MDWEVDNMKMKKVISILLAILMLGGAFVTVVGAEENATKPYEYKTSADSWKPDYATEVHETPEDKLENMDYRYGNGTYELYVDAYSGEIAVINKKTGEQLFSNPYNIASLSAAKRINKNPDLMTMTSNDGDMLMSQLVVYMKDVQTNNIYQMDSYKYAAARRQIKVKEIRGGLRVEYSIGIEETRIMAPDRISAEMFDAKIRPYIEKAAEEGKIEKNQAADFFNWYTLIDPDEFGEPGSTQRNIALAQWGVAITWEGKFYSLAQNGIDSTDKRRLAQLITEYCPDYSFEDIDAMHLKMGYSSEETVNPVVKMALEYTLDDSGLSVRLPANGIRFDEKRYVMENIEILPYMGVGLSDNGYTFFPDGSGTLFSFSELMAKGNNKVLEAAVYGADYAYQKIAGSYEEIVRYPVFGLYENYNGQNRGFLAIIEEGESLATLRNYSRRFTTKDGDHVNGVRIIVNPRQKDSFQLANAGANAPSWEVVSAKKFTGSFRIRYIMLSDKEVANTPTYACSYVGMAKAYRDYLVKNGTLTKLTADQVDMNNIPLYIETLGSMMTTKKVLSIPINMMSALTSFKDIMTIRKELAEEGITNLQFILNGYADGGLTGATVPYKLKWESAVEDDVDFEEILADAKANGYGLFPNFDFAFVTNDEWFDGLDLNDHAVKTVENRYTTKRLYSATKHTTVSTFEIALSPAYFSHFYDKLLPEYKETQPIGISVNTLGSYLNSDFDETEPYNREENKQFTIQAMQAINTQLAGVEVMTEAANAYTWKYVDHITDIAVDSSRFKDAYATVPFLGMVLHGYVELAGTPVNMEGNLDYALLKSIESGASLQFLVAYDNTKYLKDDPMLSENFSVQYKIWRNDIIDMYKTLNGVLKNVQTSAITNHQFISGVRVPDLDELERDARLELEALLGNEASREFAEKEADRAAAFAARWAIIKGQSMVIDAAKSSGETSLKYYEDAIVRKYQAELLNKNDIKDQLTDLLSNKRTTDKARETAIVAFIEELYEDVIAAMDYANEVLTVVDDAKNAGEVLKNSSFKKEIVDDLLASLENDIFNKSLETVMNKYTPEKLKATMLNNIVKRVYPKINDILKKAGSKLTMDDIAIADFDYEISNDNTSGVPGGSGTEDSNRYATDANKIVRETYENGADFLLNFNDYQVNVTVPVNGKMHSYTIDAYGFVVLNYGKNS